MRRLGKLLRLAPGDRLLLAEAALWVAAVRTGLWLLPSATLRWLLAVPTREPAADPTPIERTAWAVRAASRCVPRASCLTQALAAKVLLGRRGHPAELRIGVARGGGGRLEAHAWLEQAGRVVIGGSADLERYTRLSAALEAGRA
jgi:hypothetical protein